MKDYQQVAVSNAMTHANLGEYVLAYELLSKVQQELVREINDDAFANSSEYKEIVTEIRHINDSLIELLAHDPTLRNLNEVRLYKPDSKPGDDNYKRAQCYAYLKDQHKNILDFESAAPNFTNDLNNLDDVRHAFSNYYDHFHNMNLKLVTRDNIVLYGEVAFKLIQKLMNYLDPNKSSVHEYSKAQKCLKNIPREFSSYEAYDPYNVLSTYDVDDDTYRVLAQYLEKFSDEISKVNLAVSQQLIHVAISISSNIDEMTQDDRMALVALKLKLIVISANQRNSEIVLQDKQNELQTRDFLARNFRATVNGQVDTGDENVSLVSKSEMVNEDGRPSSLRSGSYFNSK